MTAKTKNKNKNENKNQLVAALLALRPDSGDSPVGKPSIEDKQAELSLEPAAAAAAGCLEVADLTKQMQGKVQSHRERMLARNAKAWSIWWQYHKVLAKVEGYRTKIEWSASMGFASKDDTTFREVLSCGGIASRYLAENNPEWEGLQWLAPQAQATCRALCAGITEDGKTKRFPAVLESAELQKRLVAWNAEANRTISHFDRVSNLLNESSVLESLRNGGHLPAKGGANADTSDDGDDAVSDDAGTGTAPDEATTEPVLSVTERVDAGRQAWQAAVDCLPFDAVKGAVDVMRQSIKECQQAAKKREAGAE
jgi:phage host-nuclease inhibitor protein Gam